jgi:hypothetical protein
MAAFLSQVFFDYFFACFFVSLSPATSFIFILYICPLQSPLKDFILYISFLSNNVLYTQIPILKTFFNFIFCTYVFIILLNVLYIF